MGFLTKTANDWEARVAEQEAALRKVIPTTAEATSLKAIANLKALKEQALNLGYGMRSGQQPSSLEGLLAVLNGTSVPGREVSLALPGLGEKKALFGGIIDPLKNLAQDALVGTKGLIDSQLSSGMRTTDDPSSLWWYYPSMALGVPKAFGEGYQKSDAEATGALNADLDSQLKSVKSQFDRALADEYRSAHGKAASCGELIDGLAIKMADGELGTAAGAYLALAALIGQHSYHKARTWTEDHDPRTMRAKAVKDLIRQRLQSSPPILHVDPDAGAVADIPGIETEEKTAGLDPTTMSEAIQMGGTWLRSLGGLARLAAGAYAPKATSAIQNAIGRASQRVGQDTINAMSPIVNPNTVNRVGTGLLNIYKRYVPPMETIADSVF